MYRCNCTSALLLIYVQNLYYDYVDNLHYNYLHTIDFKIYNLYDSLWSFVNNFVND